MNDAMKLVMWFDEILQIYLAICNKYLKFDRSLLYCSLIAKNVLLIFYIYSSIFSCKMCNLQKFHHSFITIMVHSYCDKKIKFSNNETNLRSENLSRAIKLGRIK